MSDFYQTGVVATLHRLGEHKPGLLTQQLERYAQEQPIAVVLPALYMEFEKPAMTGILEELSKVRYVRQFVLTLARADEKHSSRPLLEKVMEGGRRLPQGEVGLEQARERARTEIAKLPDRVQAIEPADPPYPVELSAGLREYLRNVARSVG